MTAGWRRRLQFVQVLRARRHFALVARHVLNRWCGQILAHAPIEITLRRCFIRIAEWSFYYEDRLEWRLVKARALKKSSWFSK